jgi:hypothetical protein
LDGHRGRLAQCLRRRTARKLAAPSGTHPREFTGRPAVKKKPMRAPAVPLLGLLLAAVLACSHAETVAPANAPNPPDAPTRLPSASSVTPPPQPGHPELASSPTQLMAPGSSDAIVAALRKRGLLSADTPSNTQLEAALRTFQQSQGLAATGFPDHETLRRLDIKPSTVDRTTTAPDAGS